MGNAASRKQDNELARSSHFTLSEIKKLKHEFSKVADKDFAVTKEQFRHILQHHVSCWSAGAQYLFLERLFDAFDLDGNHTIDFREFISGLSSFMKGNSDEKMELSFRLFDVDRSGSVEPKELIRFMGQMYSAFYNEDQTQKVKQTVTQLFEDLDINGDGSLSLTEFKLMALKEPMITDFVSQFLQKSPGEDDYEYPSVHSESTYTSGSSSGPTSSPNRLKQVSPQPEASVCKQRAATKPTKHERHQMLTTSSHHQTVNQASYHPSPHHAAFSPAAKSLKRSHDDIHAIDVDSDMMDDTDDSSSTTRAVALHTSSGHSLESGAPPCKRAVDAVHPLWGASNNYMVKVLPPHEHPTSFAASPFCLPNYSARNADASVSMDADDAPIPDSAGPESGASALGRGVAAPVSGCASNVDWYSGSVFSLSTMIDSPKTRIDVLEDRTSLVSITLSMYFEKGGHEFF
ncbi:hypothetical protein SeMB42_g07251 [Synchytrium endobioticum]|uniref:Calcineurin subunit B n=1 Tax=Synchytrium endobioticum TaxID=286115 RepID=A0A507CAB9_9FUNG|nr:hypothetical protein SeMB42_g07251 [Synchytrium endobioticum]